MQHLSHWAHISLFFSLSPALPSPPPVRPPILVAQVGQKADQTSIDRIVFDNSDEIERMVRSYESRSAHESKVQSAYLSDVRLQLEQVQSYQNQVDQKLQMALKFIDWFTDVKMKHV